MPFAIDNDPLRVDALSREVVTGSCGVCINSYDSHIASSNITRQPDIRNLGFTKIEARLTYGFLILSRINYLRKDVLQVRGG